MKKLIAILLSLALMLGCAAGLAEEAEKEIFGVIRSNGEFTMKGLLPEGYRIIPFQLDDDTILSWIESDDPTLPSMVLSVAYDETYAYLDRLNDADEKTLEYLEKTFTDTDPFAVITYDETEYGTRLLICRTLSDYNDYLVVFSVYNGYFVEFVMTPGKEAPEQKLTDEQIASVNTFLSQVDFVPGAEANEIELRGSSFAAEITGYDAAAGTVDLTLYVPFTLTEWQTVSINEGDTIRIGQEDVEIATLAYEGDTAIINDEYYLEPRADGLFTARLYDSTVMTEAMQLTVTLPENAVFYDGIDPKTGDPIEEPEKQTAADLMKALAGENDIVGFGTRNLLVQFDENGEITEISRIFVVWQ